MNPAIHDKMIDLARRVATNHGGTFRHDRGVDVFGHPMISVYLPGGRHCATVCVDQYGENPHVRAVQEPDGSIVGEPDNAN